MTITINRMTSNEGGVSMTTANFMKKDNNNEGGDSTMKEMLQFKVSNDDIDYLQYVVQVGEKYETQKVSGLSGAEKSKVLGETFALKMLECLRGKKENPTISFNFTRSEKNDLEIRILKQVDVEAKGAVKVEVAGKVNFVDKEKLTTGSVNPLTLRKFRCEDRTLMCELVLNQDELVEENIITKVSESKSNALKWDSVRYSLVSSLDDVSDLQVWSEKLKESCTHYMKMESAQDKLLVKFFDVLSAKRLTVITGSEVLSLSRIYANAEDHYPAFRDLYLEEQVKILTRGYFTATSKAPSGKNDKDIHVLAKYTFEVMREEQLHLEIYDGIQEYQLVEEHCRDRKIDNKLFEKKALIWSRYKYKTQTGIKLRRGFCAVDLWKLLSSSNLGNNYLEEAV